MTLERVGTVVAILVAFGSAMIQCNELGEFKGTTRTQILTHENAISDLKSQQLKNDSIEARLRTIETQQAVQLEKLEQLKEAVQKDKRR